jgi:hypothetical protein
MGLDRLRKLASELGLECSISHDGENFIIDGTPYAEEKFAREFLQSQQPETETESPFAEALALPDASPLAPKQEYEKNERGIGLLQALAQEVSAQYSGECKITGTSGTDNLPVTTGRYNLTISLKGVSMQRVTNALNALKGEE